MNLLPVLIEIIFIAGCFAGLLWSSFVVMSAKTGKIMPESYFLILEKTSELYEWAILFVITFNLFTGIFSLKNISNHSILSLDIIYLFSTMLLITFQILKEPNILICKA